MAQWVRSLDLAAHTSLLPIRCGFTPTFVNYKKGHTRLAAASDKVYQLLAQGRWFSPGTPASSITKTGRHAIVEILLKVVLKHKKKTIKSYHLFYMKLIWGNCYLYTRRIQQIVPHKNSRSKRHFTWFFFSVLCSVSAILLPFLTIFSTWSWYKATVICIQDE